MAREMRRLPQHTAADESLPNKDRVVGSRGKLSKANQALVEKYKKDENKTLVENTIDSIIFEKIYQIREVIQNMIDYGDPKVFKVIPQVLDEKIQSYGMAGQEYFGKHIRDLDGMEVYIVPVSYRRCPRCKKYKAKEMFFQSYSELNDGESLICKDCARELFDIYMTKYDRNVKECLILISHKLDMIVYEPILEKYIEYFKTPDGKAEVLKGSFLGAYIGDTFINCHYLNIPNDRLTFEESNFSGEPFKCIHKLTMPNIYDDRYVANDESEDENDDLKNNPRKIDKLRLKWGEYSVEDLRRLESLYDNWCDKYDIDDLSREKLVIQLCYEELDIFKTRMSGGNTKDKIKSYRELMKDSDLSPKKQVTVSTESQFDSLGDFIKYAELNKPIINKNKDFEDVDKITRLWRSIAGAISRTLCKDNEYVKEFEENYKEYTSTIMDKEDPNSIIEDGEEVREIRRAKQE